MSHEKPRLIPKISESRFLRQSGEYEIEFARINAFDERSSSTVISELSLDDLYSLYNALHSFLDEKRQQGVVLGHRTTQEGS